MAAAAPKSDYRSLVEDAPLEDAFLARGLAHGDDARTREAARRSLTTPGRAIATEETLLRPTLRRAQREELHFDSDPDNLTPRAKRDLRRAKHHRPIRLTWPAVMCVIVVMAQLVLLLRMNARALEASQQAGALEAQIIVTSDQIERTQQRISIYDSSAHLAQWAQERGWKPANHLDIDDVTRAGLAAAMPTPDDTAKPDAYFIEGQSKTSTTNTDENADNEQVKDEQ